jgi:hypothetical protein
MKRQIELARNVAVVRRGFSSRLMTANDLRTLVRRTARRPAHDPWFLRPRWLQWFLRRDWDEFGRSLDLDLDAGARGRSPLRRDRLGEMQKQQPKPEVDEQ